MRTWIKICATTCVEDALASIAAGADALGFIFAPSPRRISADQAREIVRQVPPNIETIGVFRNEPVQRVAQVVEEAQLTGIQLHGEETAASIIEMKAMLPPHRKISVIKVVEVNDHFEERFDQVCAGFDCIDSVLLDSGGGSGRAFDWQKAQPLLKKNKRPLILAGGLNAGNVKEAIRTFTPWGVDVVSGVEREPGRKDPEKLRAFVAAVRKTQQS
ncbi:MAG TPA: phosphoribosylanthranilate isomerase [Candidatus Angelobacter sp.]|jgi:phosphoribosylanthranilate isomerase|nr:phosphoribosylanthranilate isomerase [Candidatus Angelobacter sp.]